MTAAVEWVLGALGGSHPEPLNLETSPLLAGLLSTINKCQPLCYYITAMGEELCGPFNCITSFNPHFSPIR